MLLGEDIQDRLSQSPKSNLTLIINSSRLIRTPVSGYLWACIDFLDSNNFSSKFVDGLKSSVTRWLYYFSISGHLQQWELVQLCHKIAKVGSALCQMRNKLSKICQRLVNVCQSGKISPNLVTLAQSYLHFELWFVVALAREGFLVPIM